MNHQCRVVHELAFKGFLLQSLLCLHHKVDAVTYRLTAGILITEDLLGQSLLSA